MLGERVSSQLTGKLFECLLEQKDAERFESNTYKVNEVDQSTYIRKDIFEVHTTVEEGFFAININNIGEEYTLRIPLFDVNKDVNITYEEFDELINETILEMYSGLMYQRKVYDGTEHILEEWLAEALAVVLPEEPYIHGDYVVRISKDESKVRISKANTILQFNYSNYVIGTIRNILDDLFYIKIA